MNQTLPQEQITDVFHRMSDAWSRGDVESSDAPYSKDVKFVDTSGGLYTSRAAIEAFHRTELAGALKGSRLTTDKVTVQSIRDGVAFAIVENSFSPGDRRVVMTAILVEDNDQWFIVAAQATVKK